MFVLVLIKWTRKHKHRVVSTAPPAETVVDTAVAGVSAIKDLEDGPAAAVAIVNGPGVMELVAEPSKTGAVSESVEQVKHIQSDFAVADADQVGKDDVDFEKYGENQVGAFVRK